MAYIEIDPVILGRNLKRRRKEKQIKVTELQNYLYLGYPQSIYMWEEGRRLPPSYALINMMRLYDMTVEDLLNEEDEDDV